MMIFLTTVTMLVITWWSAQDYNSGKLSDTLVRAETVFEGHLRARGDLLVTASKVLTADFGFKQAVATRDAVTIASVLSNHSSRINADLILITDLSGAIVSSNLEQFSRQSESFLKPILKLIDSPSEIHFVVLGERLYQILLLPIHSPRLSAYALIGFEIEAESIASLHALTGLDVTFIDEGKQVLISSLSSDEAIKLNRSREKPFDQWLVITRPKYRHLWIEMDSLPADPVKAVLTASLQSSYRDFDRLIGTVLLVAFVTMCLSFLASALLVRKLTVPLARLVSVAKDFALGRYETGLSAGNQTREISELFSAFSDMGERIQAREAQVVYQAEHDIHTGLLNRYTLSLRLQQMLQERPAAETSNQFACVITPLLIIAFNVRGFRAINDNLGPQVGDACLLAVAKRMLSIEPDGLHARLSGDEFLSVLPLPSQSDAVTVVNLYIKKLEQDYQVGKLKLELTFSMGVTQFPEQGNNAKSLKRRAIIALERSRKQHHNVAYYQSGEDERYLEHLAMIDALRAAVGANDGQLFMCYQPKLDLHNNSIMNVECLVRWEWPGRGRISPELFVELAEQHAGLIHELTDWIFHNVLEQLSRWYAEGLEVGVALNISAKTLLEEDFASHFIAMVDGYEIPRSRITLELTERDIMFDEERGAAALLELKQAGIRIAIDDYGIGQSSLSKLRSLPIDVLKIDKSFILNLSESPEDQFIVRSTIELGHNLGVMVVAEGVETEATLELLKTMNCDVIQGYFLCHPLPAAEISDWLKEYNRAQVSA